MSAETGDRGDLAVDPPAPEPDVRPEVATGPTAADADTADGALAEERLEYDETASSDEGRAGTGEDRAPGEAEPETGTRDDRPAELEVDGADRADLDRDETDDGQPLAEDRLAHEQLADEDPVRGGSTEEKSALLSNREVAESDLGLPRTLDTVEHYARAAAVDLEGIEVEVVDDAETIDYLDYMEAVARTDHLGVQLGPAAFQDEETLVRTLGHESVHVQQYREGRITDSLTESLEAEAYAAEEEFVEHWRSGR